MGTTSISMAELLADQECCGSNHLWNFKDRYHEEVDKPRWMWDLTKLVSFQNIIADGGDDVKNNILKRQETYGVAFALILGCAIGVLAAIANQQGPEGMCHTTPVKSLKVECYIQQLMAAVSVGVSIMILMIVLNNINFVSSVATIHVAYTIDKYQWLFTLPANIGIPMTLIPLCLSIGMAISVNQVATQGSFLYPPSAIIYVFLMFTFFAMVAQSYFLGDAKRKRVEDDARAFFGAEVVPHDDDHVPEDRVPLMKNEGIEADENPVSHDEEQKPAKSEV